MYCKRCSKEIPDEALFCCFCGEKQQTICADCGTELVADAIFCHNCGGKVGAVNVTTNKKVYSDAHGFYGQAQSRMSVGDELLVFNDYNAVYVVDKSLNIRQVCNEAARAVSHTDDAIYVALPDYENNKIVLNKYDNDLKMISSKVLCDIALTSEHRRGISAMNGEAYYQAEYDHSYDADNMAIYQNVVLRRIDLETGKETKYAFDALTAENGYLDEFDHLLIDGNKVYIEAYFRTKNTDASCDEVWNRSAAVAVFDFDTGCTSLLWNKDTDLNCGEPLFFDFANGIMWTKATREEIKINSLRCSEYDGALVAKKIGKNTPILKEYEVWYVQNPYDLFYFDGKYAFDVPGYYNFYGVDKNGNRSKDWNPTGHGRCQTAMVWNGMVVADLLADYKYTAYPLGFEPPAQSECTMLHYDE